MDTGTPFQVREGMHAPAVRRASLAEVPIIDFGALYSPSLAERKTMARAIREGVRGTGVLLHRQPSVPAGGSRARAAPPCSGSSRSRLSRRCATTTSTGPTTGATCRRAGSRPTIVSKTPATSRRPSRWRTTCRRTIPTTCAESASTDPTTGLRSLRTFAGRSAPISTASLSSAARSSAPSSTRWMWRKGISPRNTAKPLARLRVCYYEPQPEPLDIAHIGLGAHTDYECFTTVWQDREGLQMLSPEGEWLIVPPVDGSFAVNLGDLMQQWTNDTFVSTMHRVINTSGQQALLTGAVLRRRLRRGGRGDPELRRPGQAVALRADQGGRPLGENGRPHLPLRRIGSLRPPSLIHSA